VAGVPPVLPLGLVAVLVGLLVAGLLLVLLVVGAVPPWTEAVEGVEPEVVLDPRKQMWSPRRGMRVWIVSSRPIALATTKQRRMASTRVSTWVEWRNWWRKRSRGERVGIVLVGSWGRERAIVREGVGKGVLEVDEEEEDRVVVSFGVRVGCEDREDNILNLGKLLLWITEEEAHRIQSTNGYGLEWNRIGKFLSFVTNYICIRRQRLFESLVHRYVE